MVKDLVNRAYSFQHTGHIAGIFESGSSDDNWNVSAVSNAIADNWANISAEATWRA